MVHTAIPIRADKSVVDSIGTRVTTLENIPTATTAEVVAKNLSVRKWTPNMVYNAALAVLVDRKAITEWTSTATYDKDNIVIRNKAYYISNITSNLNKDPITDSTGAWGPFVPGETNSIFFNRSPKNSDVYPPGVKWYDLSFGSDTPLVSISLGNGAWAYLNEIKLAKIRIYGHGVSNTYRSNIRNLKFFKPDGTQIPNGWFVWGASSALWGAGAGVAYNGQAIEGGYNANGWMDIEVSSQFDSSIIIDKVTADYPTAGTYFNCYKLEFYYTSGSKKTFSGAGNLTGSQTLCICDPNVICRYGDATSAAQGEMLTASKLSDPNDTTYGRISGAALNSAFNILVANLVSSDKARVDTLENRTTALETIKPADEYVTYTMANELIEVTLGNYKIQLGGSGARCIHIATVSGTATIDGMQWYNNSGFAQVSNFAVTTTMKRIHPSWSFGSANDRHTINFKDDNENIWEFSMWIGASYNNNGFQMRKIK